MITLFADVCRSHEAICILKGVYTSGNYPITKSLNLKHFILAVNLPRNYSVSNFGEYVNYITNLKWNGSTGMIHFLRMNANKNCNLFSLFSSDYQRISLRISWGQEFKTIWLTLLLLQVSKSAKMLIYLPRCISSSSALKSRRLSNLSTFTGQNELTVFDR